MGAADAVPGVSGGTMALVLGIYEQLLDAITSIDKRSIRSFLTGRWSAFSGQVPWRFVATLLVGIAAAVLTVARILETVLETNPDLLFAFFFGLVAASVWVVGRKLAWSPLIATLVVAGAAIGAIVVSLSAAEGRSDPVSLFLSGAVAICAMILPGISGAFILLLLGQYATILAAVNDRDLSTIALVGGGAVIGLLLFARVLRRLLNRWHDATLSVLVGFMAGSLLKIWPWRECTEFVGDRCLSEQLLGPSSNWPAVVGLAVAGGGLVLVFDVLERRRARTSVDPVDETE